MGQIWTTDVRILGLGSSVLGTSMSQLARFERATTVSAGGASDGQSPFLSLSTELTQHCIDHLDKDAKALLAISCVSRATRSLVMGTDAYRNFVQTTSQALLDRSLHSEGPLGPSSAVRVLKKIALFKVPDTDETPEKVHNILCAADAAEAVVLNSRWFQAPFFPILQKAFDGQAMLKSLTVVSSGRKATFRHEHAYDWTHDALSSSAFLALTGLMHTLAAKGSCTLDFGIPINADNLKKLFSGCASPREQLQKLELHHASGSAC